jgi:dihydropteroate synthase
VVGILNVTPDSFSDGGRHATRDAAVRHGLRMHAAGADLVDVGGESTRPGAHRVPAREEIRRTADVVADLVAAGAAVSIDTTRRLVAEAAVAAGACVVNDVSGGRAEPQMRRFVAEAGCGFVLMHWRAPSRSMARFAVYDDVVAEVRDEIARSVDLALAAGVPADRIAVDPGLGFAKQAAHDWELLARLDRIVDLGLPVLVGASRKSFLAPVTSGPTARDRATAAVSVAVALAGGWGVRVHDVRASLDAVQVVAAMRAAANRSAGQYSPSCPPNRRSSPCPT